MKTLWSRAFPVIATLAMAFAFNATAQPVLSVVRSGVQNIYKGSCSYGTTTFTITASYAVATNYDMYFFIGGDGNDFPPICPCDAFRGHDFNASGTDLSIGAFGTVPNLYEMGMQAGHTTAVITITTLNTPSTNDCDYETLNFVIPTTIDYTEGSYTVNPNANKATANVYPSDPGEPYVGISTSINTIYKSEYPNSMTLTLTASFAFPGEEFVTFLVGGDGTTFNNDPSPCLAYRPTDFTVSGAYTAPFPNGYYVIFNAGDTQKQVTITAAGSGCSCDDGFQSLIITVPTPPSCSGYQPGYPSQITDYIYP